MAEPEVQEIEDRAKRMGWVAKADFKGADDRWIEADKFLARGENELPILRERLRTMDGNLVKLTTKISGMKETFGEFQRHQRGVAERAYDKAMADLTEKQRVAVEKGDVASFDTAEKKKEKLKLEVPVIKEGDDQEAVEFNEWVGENAWYDSNPELQEYANHMSVFIQNKKNIGGKKLYDAVKKEVELRYPEKFENKNRQVATAVVGDGEPPVKPGKRNFAALPKDAQEQCLKFIKDISGYTKEEYVKDYMWE